MDSTNTCAQAINYGKTTPQRDGASWAGWCASLMFRAGNLPNWAARPSAIDAYRSSSIVSMEPNDAPCGAFHFWDIGSDGHVAMSVGGGVAMMASRHLTTVWGDAIGTIGVRDYSSSSGARYLGWSYDYAGAEIADVRRPGPQPGPPSPGGVPKTSTSEDGIPGTIFYMRMQLLAQRNGYSGPIDGVMGRNSWAGVQRAMRQFGYSGPDDGIPGMNTYKAMQNAARQYGYTGPIDGQLGPNSYRGFAKFLNTL